MTTRQKFKNLIFNYSIVVGIFFIYFFAVGVLVLVFPELNLQSLKEVRLEALMNESPLKFFFLAVIFAPVLEEGLYRTLVKPKPEELAFFISCLSVVLAMGFIPGDVFWWLKYGIAFITLFIVFKTLKELLPVSKTKALCSWLSRYTIPVIIISSIIFGFAHVGNYVETFTVTWPIFIAIIPRIILGVMFSKVKIENDGLIWAMGLHAINNGIVFIIGYFTLEAFSTLF